MSATAPTAASLFPHVLESQGMHPALKVVEHRPWPLPSGPWVMEQVWNDLLFAHWPVSPETLRPLVPQQLPLDTYEGQCWIGVVPFWMSGVQPRGIPEIPGLSRFPELNVRTYVTLGGKPGVYFFSLDAGSRLAVWGARAFYHLAYFYAEMSVEPAGNEFAYRSSRRGSNAELRARYAPHSAIRLRAPGTLEHWLTERYCLYTAHRARIYRCEIHHAPWPLQDASAQISANTMASAAGIHLPHAPPLLHFSKRQEVLVWPLQPAEENRSGQNIKRQ